MSASGAKGNAPDKWEKLLVELDEKLQLGLLDRLRRAVTYHLEGGLLQIEPGSPEDAEYLGREPVLQQLRVFAEDIGAREIKILPPPQ